MSRTLVARTLPKFEFSYIFYLFFQFELDFSTCLQPLHLPLSAVDFTDRGDLLGYNVHMLFGDTSWRVDSDLSLEAGFLEISCLGMAMVMFYG